MAWEELRTDYADAVFDGLRKYMVTENPDGSYSFSDVTQYTVRENSFIGAKDINAMNTAMNLIMAALNDGTDLYDVFTQFFIEQQELFASSADDYQNDFKNYLGELRIAIMDQCEQLKNDYTGDITKFKELQKAVYEEWFAMIKASLSENAAGKLLLQLEDHKSNEEIHITGVEREAWNGKMEPDGDSAENTVTFESGDTEDPAVWADVGVIESGEKHGSLFRKISLAVRNTRFLKKMLEKLNTDLSGKVSKSDVINNLISTDTDKPLSAAQGRALANGNANDSTARLALTKNVALINFSSSTIFTRFGAQYIVKIGKMAFVHLYFSVNATLEGNNIFAIIPSGFFPDRGISQIPLVNVLDGSRGTVTFGTDGIIRGDTGFLPGNYCLDFSYPIA